MNQPDSSSSPDNCSCSDYRASRRAFLKGLTGATVGTVGLTMFGDTFRQVAYGGTAGGNVLVVLSLRGGADSLSIVVPHGEDAYYAARPGIAIPRASLVAADSTFGLHPALGPLGDMWRGSQMAAVVATGLRVPNRSHFAATEAVEDADPGSEARRGWINRMIGLDTEDRPQEAVSLGGGPMPTSMWGPVATLAARRVDDLDLPGIVSPDRRRRKMRSLHQVWDGVNTSLGTGARTSLRTATTMAELAATPYTPRAGSAYPGGKLSDALKDTARLVKADLGVEVVSIDHGSWDMHNNVGAVGSLGSATMHGMLNELATSLRAFFTDLGAVAGRVTLVTITEFGRRVAENGNGGLDHGWANAMLLLGAGVNGGKYHGAWPGLGSADLVDGDLAVRTDYRSVLTEVLRSRFDVATSKVFPGFVPEAVGAML